MALLEMKFLGGLTLQQDGVSLTEVKSQKGRALLCYLAVSQKQVSRSYLAALFWPDMPDEQALMNLRKVLNRLKPLTTYLLITRETVAFNQEADSWLDATEFERETAVKTDIPHLQKSLTHYHGDFLDGFMLADAPLFEEWVLAQRARLREVALTTLHQLVAHFKEEGGYETAVGYARQLLIIEPWHEETHRELMRLLAFLGQRSDALAQYEICRHLLVDELGVAPTTATVQLLEQIKTGQVSAGAEARNSSSESFPPHNLPPQMTPFVGRESELAQLHQLLLNPDNHLITILGAGGMGKTRLALAFAAQQLGSQQQPHPFPQGVYFVSLARLETAVSLVTALAEAINFRFGKGDDLQAQFLRYLSSKAMLLVLDNFEHLLAGVDLLDAILRTAPKIKIIVTSRIRLNRQIEQLFPLEGLTYPQAEAEANSLDLDDYSAVQLFCQCAHRVQPNFGLTAVNQPHVLEICRLMQGMPLGIVLAAAWLESLSPRAISREMGQDIDFLSTEMGDVPRRQRSLRAAFNHSWRLLTPHEQAIFPQLSHFRGGFTRQASQAVAGAGVRDLQGLVNKSLLTLTANGRYDVHELLRQFAAEKLSESSAVETAVSDRHSDYYCTLLQQHTANWHNSRQLEAVTEVTREAANVQRAWHWALQQKEWQRLHDAIDSWSWYHKWHGHHDDGEAFCQAVCTSLEGWLTTKREDAATEYLLWAKAMTWYGQFMMAIKDATLRFQQSLALLAQPELADKDTRREKAFVFLCLGERLNGLDRQQARSFTEQSLSLYEALLDPWGIAQTHLYLGSLEWSAGNYELAQKSVQVSLDIQQKQGDQWQQADSLTMLAWIKQHMGELAEAEQLRRQALELCQQLGERIYLIYCAASLSFTITWLGRFDEGRAWAEKSLAFCQEDGYRAAEGFVYLAIGYSLFYGGHYEQAQQRLTQALVSVREANNHGTEATVHYALGCLALVEGAYDKAQLTFEESLRLYQAVQSDTYTVLALCGLGFSTCCRGVLDQSRQYFIRLLTIALKRKDFLYLLVALPGVALYLVRSGEVEQAIVVWAQAQCQPYVANSQWYEDMVGREITAVTANLSPEVVRTAWERGLALDLWETAVMLLNILQ